MATTNDLKNGMVLNLDGQLWAVTEFQHVKPGKGGAFVRTTLKNVLSGKVVDRTFNAGTKVDTATVDKRNMTYLYKDGTDFVFMDGETYDQIHVPAETVGGGADYLLENTEAVVAVHEGTPLYVELPVTLELVVQHTDPGLQADRSTGTRTAGRSTGCPTSTARSSGWRSSSCCGSTTCPIRSSSTRPWNWPGRCRPTTRRPTSTASWARSSTRRSRPADRRTVRTRRGQPRTTVNVTAWSVVAVQVRRSAPTETLCPTGQVTARPSTRRVARFPSTSATPNVVPRTCTSEPLPLNVTEQEFPEQDTRLTEPDLDRDPDPPAADALIALAETPALPAAAAPL